MIYRRTTWVSLIVLDVILFVVAAIIGQHPKQHWKDVLGGIGWFGFLLVTAVLIVMAVAWLARGRRRSVAV